MPHRFHRRRGLALAAALLASLALAPSALAGQWRITYDLSGASTPVGWSAPYVESGFLGCTAGTPGGCPDLALPRLMARPGTAKADWGQARIQWTAPPTTRIVSGTLSYRTRMADAAFAARVKTKDESASWADGTTLASDVRTTMLGTQVQALAPGFREVAIALYSHPGVASSVVSDAWQDYVTLSGLDVVVDDATPPAMRIAEGRELFDGRWHHGERLCAVVAADDAGAGLGSVTAESGAAVGRWDAPPTGVAYQPGSAAAAPLVCLDGAALGDGTHAGAIRVRDAVGNLAPAVPFSVAVDTTPPEGAVDAPGATTTLRRPDIAVNGWDHQSGVADVSAWLDGAALPLELRDGRWRTVPASELGFGDHLLTWAVTDRSGLVRRGSSTFRVVDVTPPALGGLRPEDGETVTSSRPALAFSAFDEGTGVDPASVSLTLDGAAVPGASFAAGVLTALPSAPLAPGSHRLAARAADRAGNVATRSWTFVIVDTTPPAIDDLRPGDGASVDSSLPLLSFRAADDGTGVDPASVRLTLDGAELPATVDAGRLTAGPPAPLAGGVHRVRATAADRAGNVGTRPWTFTVPAGAPGAVGGGASPSGGAAPAGGAPVGGGTLGGSGTTAGGGTGAAAPLRLRALRPWLGPTRARSVLVSFRAQRGPRPIRGVAVRLTIRAGKAVHRVRRTSDRGGLVRVRVSLAGSASVTAQTGAARAVARLAALRVDLALRALPTRPRAGQSLVVAGGSRAVVGRSVLVEALGRRGWAVVARTRADAAGRFQALVVVPAAGRYVIRARVGGTGGGVSRPLMLTARA